MRKQQRSVIKDSGMGLVLLLLLLFFLSSTVHAETNGNLTASLNATETVCTINLSGYTMPSDGAVVSAAVWSAKGGQDDLHWRDMKNSAGTYTVSFNVSEHATSGSYYVHLYLRTKTGKMVFLKNTEFTVTPASASVSAGTVDQNAGKCQVVVSNVKCPSGIKAVQIPVWSKSNQSDIIWYPASQRTDGSWAITIDFSRHGGNAGTYHVHTYITGKNKCQDFVGETKVGYKINIPETPVTPETPVVSASLNGEKCALKVSGLKNSGSLRTVLFAVWSKTDGQDDLRWETASFNSSTGTAEKTISLADYCDYGLYNVHVYGVDSANKYTLLCKTEFDLPYPKINSMNITTDAKNFKIKMSDFSCSGGIDRIKVAVWSKSDQNDLVWYIADKQADGSYVVSSDISKHKNNYGTYHAHAYLYDGRDSYGHCAATADFTIKETATPTPTPAPVTTAGELKVTASTDRSQYTATIQDIRVAAAYSKLLAAVWSQNGGQDDLKWYTAAESGSSATVKIPMVNHKDTGNYFLHLYAQKTDGGMQLVKAYTFTVEKPESNTSTMSFENQARSTVDVRLRLSSDIKAAGVVIPVWSKSNQSDIKWYNAVKQSDGSYKITIDVANHAYNEGIYHVHAYYRDSAGNLKFVCGSNVELFAPEAGGTLQEEGCVITGGNTVAVTVTVGNSGTYGLFAIEGEESFNPGATPLATVTGSGKITLKAPLGMNTAGCLINKKLIVGIKNGSGYSPVTKGMYITNPEAAATNTRAFPTTSTKKGLQVNPYMPEDAAELGVKHSVVNVVLNNIPCQSGGISYNYNGKIWHMDMGYIYSLDQIFAQQAANGSVISAILLMQWDSEWSDLIIASGRTPGHSFYGLNAETKAAREQLAAIFSFLAERYSGSSYNVVNWILGNEVDDYTDYNWCGNIGLNEYAAYYAHAFRLLYNSTKSKYSNARVYISLDHVWNYPRNYGFKGMELFNAFVAELQAEGDINWNIAFHPYPNPITSPNFWKNTQGVSNSSSSAIFTMLNLRSLTDYIRNTYGSQHRFILSETGFTSWSGGVTDEKLQAAAIAYGYYLAEFNDMVDSFCVHRHVDNTTETNRGLYLGLWYTDPALIESATTKKLSWSVFKYMDTSQGAAYTNFALPIIGADSWNSIVPGYSAARFS